MTKLPAALVALFVLLLPALAHAQTTVCASGCDYTSIETAITNATAGDIIQLYAETYTEPHINVSVSVTIQGDPGGGTIVQAYAIRGTGSQNVFDVPASTTVTMRDFTIRNGYRNVSPDRGGGIENFGTLYLERMVFQDNAADYYGSQIWNNGTLTLTQCRLRGGYNAEAIHNTSLGVITMDETEISGTAAAGIHNYGALTASNSAIIGNAYRGIYNDSSSAEVRLYNCTVSNNVVVGSDLDGGGIYNIDGVVDLE